MPGPAARWRQGFFGLLHRMTKSFAERALSRPRGGYEAER